jgi:hypothetical protein
MIVCAMIFNALDVPEEADDVWTEEFLIDGKPGGRTLNVAKRLLVATTKPHSTSRRDGR